MALNTITLSGNIGNDPELKQTKSGGSILKWRMAGRSGYGDNEKPVWVGCSILQSNRAQSLSGHLNKGDHITVQGELQIDDWEDRDGNKRTSVEIIVRDLVFVGGGKAKADSPHQQAKANGYQDDDRIPF